MSETKHPRQVEVVLGKAHIHAGERYAAGATIKVTEPEAKWLADNGITQSAPAAQIGGRK